MKRQKKWGYWVPIGVGVLGYCFMLYYNVITMLYLFEPGGVAKKILTIGTCLSGLAFLLLIKQYITARCSNLRYQKLSGMQRRLIEKQQDYYQMLFHKEEETKKFRHDIKNHIYCIKFLAEKQKYEELKVYILSIQEKIEQLKVQIETGNDIVNAIANDYYERCMKEQISFHWEGGIPNDISINSMDLCTIFSNLLENAYEATSQIKNKEKRFLQVTTRRFRNNVMFTFANSITKPVIIKRNQLRTTKFDRENHGFGSMNVVECVEENNGTITFTSSDTQFLVEIFFSNSCKEPEQFT